jgi:FecR protein
MQKNLFNKLLLIIFLSFFSSLSIAAEKSSVGVISAAIGEVYNQDGKKLSTGDKIYFGDSIVVKSNSNSQIMLLDETVMSVGSNSEIKIDEFVYDKKSQNGKILSTIKSGSMRVLTGGVSEKNPANLEIKVPAGTIGSRGTEFQASVDNGQSKVLLIGPGPNNSAGLRPGSIQVSNALGSVLVNKPYNFTQMSANVSPSTPVPIPASELKLFQQRLEARAAAAPATKLTSDKNLTSSVLGSSKQQQIVDTIAKNVVAATSLNSASATTISSAASAASTANKTPVATLASVVAPKIVTPVSSSLFNTGTYKYDSGNITMSGATGVFSAGTFKDVTTINFGTRSVTSVYSGNFTTTAGANTGTTNFSYTSTATYAKTVTAALSQETNFQIANKTGVTTTGSLLNQTQTSLYNSTGPTLTGASGTVNGSTVTPLASTFNVNAAGGQVAAFGKFSTATGSAGTATLRLETSNNDTVTYTPTAYGAKTPSVITGTKTNIVGTKQ